MSARDAVTRHCGYNSCAGDVTCECVCVGCIVACRRFADAVLRKATEAEASRPTPTTWPPARDPAADLARALEHLEAVKNEEVEKARREGRDAGLREAMASFEAALRDPDLHADNIPGLRLAIRRAARIAESAPTPAPDVASLQAVAEAALLCAREGTEDNATWIRLLDALDAAGMTGWRTAS